MRPQEDVRTALLKTLQRHRRSVSLPSRWQSRRQFDDLAARFLDALAAAKGEGHYVSTWAEALARLGDVLSEVGARQAVVNQEPPLDTVDFPALWPQVTWYQVGKDEGDLRAFCAQADVGISGAAAALAETGSVVVESGPGRSRLATLLPPVHVALVSVHLLTADLFTWLARRSSGWPASLTIISGPSKTADIEQTLAVGVHGPKRFVVILYGEE